MFVKSQQLFVEFTFHPKVRQTDTFYRQGTGVLITDKRSEEQAHVFSDARPEELASLPDDAPHRDVDLIILEKKKALKGKAKIVIILPPTIHGGMTCLAASRANAQTIRQSVLVPSTSCPFRWCT